MRQIIALALANVNLAVFSQAIRSSDAPEGSVLSEPVGVFNYLADKHDDKTMARTHKELLEDIKSKLVEAHEEGDINYLNTIAGNIIHIMEQAAAEPKKTRKPRVKKDESDEGDAEAQATEG